MVVRLVLSFGLRICVITSRAVIILNCIVEALDCKVKELLLVLRVAAMYRIKEELGI